MPIAIACSLLLTGPPFPPLPDRRVPRFCRRTALATVLLAASPYFLSDFFRELELFFIGIFILGVHYPSVPVAAVLVTERANLPVIVEADSATLFLTSTAFPRMASRVSLPDVGASKIPIPAPAPTPTKKPMTREGQ